MQNPLRQDSPVYRFLNFIAHLMILNFCFIVTSIPLVTVGSSSAALMYAFKHDMTIKDYLKGFRENWKQGLICWVVSLALFALLGFDIYLFFTAEGSSVLITVAILLAFTGLMIFSWSSVYICFYEAPTLTVIKNCIVLGLANLVRTISAVVTVLVFPVVILCFPYWALRLGFIWVTFGFALLGFSNYNLLKPILEKLNQSYEQG